MPPWRAWLRSARPLAHANIAPPILFGQALAYAATGRFAVEGALLAHAIGLVDHLAIVWANDLADEAGDRLHTAPTLVSGGSRVLVEGALTPRSLRRALLVAVVALLGAGAVAVATGRPLILPLVLAALVLLWLYSGPPLRSHRGGGAVLQGLGVGVVLPLVGVAAQRATIPPSWLVPGFALAAAGHWVTSIPDEDADRAAEKRTLAVARGGLFARRAALVLSTIALVLGAALLPGAPVVRSTVLAAALLASGPAWRVHRDAGPAERRLCLTYVVSLGLASAIAWLGWCGASLTS